MEPLQAVVSGENLILMISVIAYMLLPIVQMLYSFATIDSRCITLCMARRRGDNDALKTHAGDCIRLILQGGLCNGSCWARSWTI